MPGPIYAVTHCIPFNIELVYESVYPICVYLIGTAQCSIAHTRMIYTVRLTPRFCVVLGVGRFPIFYSLWDCKARWLVDSRCVY